MLNKREMASWETSQNNAVPSDPQNLNFRREHLKFG